MRQPVAQVPRPRVVRRPEVLRRALGWPHGAGAVAAAHHRRALGGYRYRVGRRKAYPALFAQLLCSCSVNCTASLECPGSLYTALAPLYQERAAVSRRCSANLLSGAADAVASRHAWYHAKARSPARAIPGATYRRRAGGARNELGGGVRAAAPRRKERERSRNGDGSYEGLV